MQTAILGGSLTIVPALFDACGSTNKPVNTAPFINPGNTGPMKGIENVSLVKEQSSPVVYLIVGDTKFRIASIYEFNDLGFNMNKIRVVVDGTLSSFTQQLLHAAPDTRPSDVFFDCGQDYTDLYGFHSYNCKNSSSIVRKDVLVAGWLKPNLPHINDTGVAPGVEDVHYAMSLDAVFLDRMYGPNGLSTALNEAKWSGNPPAPTPLDFANTPPAAPKAIDFNSWILPGNTADMNPELNSWHTQDTGHVFSTHFKGRGPHPENWEYTLPQDADAWFPFNPLDPEGTGQPLKAGDYIVMRGTLWQDTAHTPTPGDPDVWWNTGPTINHNGWSEIHPPDWIVRVRPPEPNARLTAGTSPNSLISQDVTGPQQLAYLQWGPDFGPSSSSRLLRVRSIQRLIDGRMTNDTSVVSVKEYPSLDNLIAGIYKLVAVDIVIQPTGTQQARLKASWLVGWSEIDSNDVVWVDDHLPAGALLYEDGEKWDWTQKNVFFGLLAHRSALVSGMHQHYFLGATNRMSVAAGGTLFAMVYLDPDSPPDEVMLQWHSTDWLSRAYWGDNRLDWGTDGTADRHYMGPLPPTGEWVRLEVPAAAVGMNVTPLAPIKVDGMAFTLFGGSAIWDYAGVNPALKPQNAAFISQNMTSSLQPYQTISAMVTMMNTGFTTWVAGGNNPYRLGSQNPQDNTTWGLNRVDLPMAVPPGASVTFKFTVTAPAQPGHYNFQWRMINEGVEWFGDYTYPISVNVANVTADVSVPNLVGQSLTDAVQTAKQVGLYVQVIASVVGKVDIPRVTGQTPPPGTRVARDTTIGVDIVRPSSN